MEKCVCIDLTVYFHDKLSTTKTYFLCVNGVLLLIVRLLEKGIFHRATRAEKKKDRERDKKKKKAKDETEEEVIYLYLF